MVTITNFKVSPISGERLWVSWDVSDGVDASNYTFSLYRTGSPELVISEADSLFTEKSDMFEYIDQGISLASKERNPWYFLIIKDNDGNEKQYGPVQLDYDGPMLANVLKYRMNYLLHQRDDIAVDVAVLKKKKWGSRCLECWDEVSRRVVKSDCDSCYTTGYQGGYYSPIYTQASFTVNPPEKSYTKYGEMENRMKAILFSDYPKVNTHDIIIERKTDTRWRVQDPGKPTRLQGHLIHQLVRASEMDPYEDVEYGIDIEWTE